MKQLRGAYIFYDNIHRQILSGFSKSFLGKVGGSSLGDGMTWPQTETLRERLTLHPSVLFTPLSGPLRSPALPLPGREPGIPNVSGGNQGRSRLGLLRGSEHNVKGCMDAGSCFRVFPLAHYTAESRCTTSRLSSPESPSQVTYLEGDHRGADPSPGARTCTAWGPLAWPPGGGSDAQRY